MTGPGCQGVIYTYVMFSERASLSVPPVDTDNDLLLV